MPKICCLNTWGKIPHDEPVFIIRGKDKLAADAVQAWIDSAEENGVNAEKIDLAQEHLEAILEFQADHPERCKLPD
jgi:hypothetical protein